MKGFAPISLVAVAPLIITVTNDLPVKTVGELIAYAKKNPRKLSFGSSGVGAAAHLTSELMKQVTGIDMVHVPYAGIGRPRLGQHPGADRRADRRDGPGPCRQDPGTRDALQGACARCRGSADHR